MSQTYIAYTIGPVYETILQALTDTQKTRRLYAGSRYFSHFMQILLRHLYDTDDIEILVPWPGDKGVNFSDKHFEGSVAGIFHDRLMATTSLDVDRAQEAFDRALKSACEVLAQQIGSNSNITHAEILRDMDNHSLVMNEDDLKKINTNIILAINQMLDIMELKREFEYDIPDNNTIAQYIENYLQGTISVKSTEEIAGRSNYYAVIVADGDKMGRKIINEATDDPKKIVDISRKLHTFFEKTNGSVDIATLTNEHYGGQLIYAGGDDVLAFLPARYLREDGGVDHTFFNYLHDLSEAFKTHVGDDVSMSFGVAIVYVKHPLKLAIKEALDLLYAAKDHAPNSVAIRLRKHSGQWYESIHEMNKDSYTHFKKLAEGILREEIALPHAIHHTLSRYQHSIITLYKNEQNASPLFATVFNDLRSDKETEAIDKLREYLDAFAPEDEQSFKRLYSSLNVLKFLRGDRDAISTNP
jgi:CRISPR-associated protein Cmr2